MLGQEVAVRAGHTSVRVVLDVYGHLWPEQDQVLAARLDEMVGSGEARNEARVTHPRPSPWKAKGLNL